MREGIPSTSTAITDPLLPKATALRSTAVLIPPNEARTSLRALPRAMVAWSPLTSQFSGAGYLVSSSFLDSGESFTPVY